MLLDVEKTLLEPVLVFSRIKAGDGPFEADTYRIRALEGCWREMPSRSVDGSGNEATSTSLRLQIPADGFVDYKEFIKAPEGLWTLSKGDYVARGSIDWAASAVRFADGFLMPYEVVARDVGSIQAGFAINPPDEGWKYASIPTVKAAVETIRIMRQHGGVSVRAWRDCRRPVSIGGPCGKFGSMIHIEG